MAKGPCPRCKTRPRNKSDVYSKPCRQDQRAENVEGRKAAQDKYEQSAKGQKKRRAYRTSPKGEAVHKAYRTSPEGRKVEAAAKRRFEKSPKGRARRERWMKTAKGKRARRRWREMSGLRLIANLPVEVVQPFAERLVIEAGPALDAPGRNVSVSGKGKPKRNNDSGFEKVARATGIQDKTLREICNGNAKSVTIEVADKLSMHGDFSLVELYDRATEWAQLTGSKWPKGYKPRKK